MSFIKSSFWVSLITFTITFISFINQVLVAHYFGAKNELDNYLRMTSLPLMLAGVLGAVYSFSLIPFLAKKKEQLQNDKFQDFFIDFLTFTKNKIIYLSVFGSLVSALFLWKKEINSFENITIIFSAWFLFFLSIIHALLICFYNANRKFITPLISNGLQYLCSILSIHLLNTEIGVLSILLGLVFGNIIGIVILLAAIPLGFSSSKRAKEIQEFTLYYKKMKFTAFGMLTFSIFQFIDSYWTSNLPESSMSYLGYSQRLIIALGSLVIAGPSTVLIPRLSIAVSEKRMNDYYDDSSLILKIVFAIVSVFSVLIYLFAEEIVTILFERGEFSKSSTLGVSEVLSIMVMGMNFMLLVVIIFRVLFIREITWKIGFTGILTSLLYFILSGLLSKYYGVVGIAFAYSITWAIIFLYSIRLLFKQNSSRLFKKNSLFFSKQIIALCTMSLIGMMIREFFLRNVITQSLLEQALYLFCISAILLSIYLFIVIKLLKIAELIFFAKKIQNLVYTRLN